jgi:excisionase family DNA binding protein
MYGHLVTAKEAAEKLGVSIFTIRAWQAQRKLAFVKLGRRVGFRPEDLDRFVEKNLVEAREAR